MLPLTFSESARQDISQDENNVFAQGLLAHAYMHIDGAIEATKRAIRE